MERVGEAIKARLVEHFARYLLSYICLLTRIYDPVSGAVRRMDHQRDLVGDDHDWWYMCLGPTDTQE